MDLGPTEMALPALCDLLQLLRSRDVAIGPTELAWLILCCLIASLRSYRVDAIGATETRFALAIAHRSIRDVPVGPIKIPNVHIFYTVRCHRVLWIGATELGQKCVTVGFRLEAIYTPPPLLPHKGEPSECAYTSTIHFLIENHLLMCWDQDIPIQSFDLDF